MADDTRLSQTHMWWCRAALAHCKQPCLGLSRSQSGSQAWWQQQRQQQQQLKGVRTQRVQQGVSMLSGHAGLRHCMKRWRLSWQRWVQWRGVERCGCPLFLSRQKVAVLQQMLRSHSAPGPQMPKCIDFTYLLLIVSCCAAAPSTGGGTARSCRRKS